MPARQQDFFGSPEYPDGFRYQPNLISAAQEAELLRFVRELDFRKFEFQGYVGKRRVVSFGWQYDFNTRTLNRADDIPEFLIRLRETAARFAGLDAARLQHVLVTEYTAGSAIGWHRDKHVFGEIVGISLLSPCVFRLRRKSGNAWERVSITAEPRSAYLLSGSAREDWEHSIPGLPSLRYSITYRNLRDDA